MDKSKSPHFVKRLETNDPNGSTVAPVPIILNVPQQMCCQQNIFHNSQTNYLQYLETLSDSWLMVPHKSSRHVNSRCLYLLVIIKIPSLIWGVYDMHRVVPYASYHDLLLSLSRSSVNIQGWTAHDNNTSYTTYKHEAPEWFKSILKKMKQQVLYVFFNSI